MKVFISWSGERSKEMANALREWLPMVLQYVDPFVSDKDISAGDRWAQKIAGELESSNFGIICITPENLSSEWVLFEAGALSKSMLEGKVIPLLFRLELSDLSGPLSQFQAQKVEETGIIEVVNAINAVAENKADQKIIDRAVPALYPQLEKSLNSIPEIAPTEKHKRPANEILEEIVTDVRGLNSSVRKINAELTDLEGPRRGASTRFHPVMIDEFAIAAQSISATPVALLFLASLVRDDYPWVSEILIETYRDIQSSKVSSAVNAIQSARNLLRGLVQHPAMREMVINSKHSSIPIEGVLDMLELILNHTLVSQTSSRKTRSIADEMDDEIPF